MVATRPLWLRRICALGVLAVALGLAGCANTLVLDNQVQSFSALPARPADLAYRFERLPSQQNDLQAHTEALADPALFKAGFQRNDLAPRYSVQVSARVQRVLSPLAEPWDRWPGGGRRFHSSPSSLLRMEPPYYQREVTLVVRELPAARVVFESQAVNDGPWSDDAAVLGALFEAALQGFPNPAAGLRNVSVVIPAR